MARIPRATGIAQMAGKAAEMAAEQVALKKFKDRIVRGEKLRIGKYTIHGVNAHGTYYRVSHGNPPKFDEMHRSFIAKLLTQHEPVAKTPQAQAAPQDPPKVEDPAGRESWRNRGI